MKKELLEQVRDALNRASNLIGELAPDEEYKEDFGYDSILEDIENAAKEVSACLSDVTYLNKGEHRDGTCWRCGSDEDVEAHEEGDYEELCGRCYGKVVSGEKA